MDYIYYALVYLSMLLYAGLPFFWLLRHYVFINYDGKKAESKIITYALIAIFEIAIFYVASPFVAIRSDMPQIVSALGVALLIFWALLEGWSLFLLISTVKDMRKMETKLVQHGPYKYIRHPVYVAHVLFNFGAYLVTGALIPLLVLVEWLILIKPLADMEDEELALRFEEEFQKYRKKVPQLIPKMG